MAGCTSAPEQDPTELAGAEFRDCPDCPIMITIPTGGFMMGTAAGQELIDPRTGTPATNDQPQHRVSLFNGFAIGKYEVTTGQYSEFVAATGYQPPEGCMDFSEPEKFVISNDIDWYDTGFPQSTESPVACISYFDALAYTDWLSATTQYNYRLPTEAEWEYATRAGTTTPYHWGADETQSCMYANVRSKGADTISTRQAESDVNDGFPCDDQATQSSAVGSYLANDFNLHDMQGNAWEWTADCNHKDYVGAPTDGSAWIDSEDCRFGVIRGGSFLNRVERSSVTVRAGRPRSGRATNMGFRVVRDHAAAQETVSATDTAPAFGNIDNIDISVPGARLFADNCAACHQESINLTGMYGKDEASLVKAITYGGNNVMSMPAFGERLTADEISTLASYLRDVNNWN
jgi:formylglycine-generating enzyme required for sulfatase activity